MRPGFAGFTSSFHLVPKSLVIIRRGAARPSHQCSRARHPTQTPVNALRGHSDRERCGAGGAAGMGPRFTAHDVAVPGGIRAERVQPTARNRDAGSQWLIALWRDQPTFCIGSVHPFPTSSARRTSPHTQAAVPPNRNGPGTSDGSDSRSPPASNNTSCGSAHRYDERQRHAAAGSGTPPPRDALEASASAGK